MIWVILAVIIFAVLFVMILVPKAAKGYNVDWGKGFTRVFYVAAFILAGISAIAAGDAFEDPILPKVLLTFVVVLLISIGAIKALVWVLSAFKKEKK